MEDDYRRNRKKGNPIREWFSDNLRYIILILLIAAIVFGVLFIAKTLRDRGGETEGSRMAAGQETGDTAADSLATSVTAEATPTPTPTPTEAPTETPTPEPTPEGHYLSETDAEASQTVQDYFQGLLNSAENTAVENYSRFTVLTTPGEKEGDVVALASYLVKYKGFAEEVPSLTDFYLTKDENGQYVLVDDLDLTPEQERIRNEVSLDVDAQTLIKNVRAELEAVLDGNAELKAFLEGLG